MSINFIIPLLVRCILNFRDVKMFSQTLQSCRGDRPGQFSCNAVSRITKVDHMHRCSEREKYESAFLSEVSEKPSQRDWHPVAPQGFSK